MGRHKLGKQSSTPRKSSTQPTKVRKSTRKSKSKLKSGRGISTALYGGNAIPSLSVFGVRRDD